VNDSDSDAGNYSEL